MKYTYCLLAIIALSFFVSSCAKRAEADESVLIEDKPVREEQAVTEEVVFDDSTLSEPIVTSSGVKEESVLNNDASKTTVIYDGYGNKFEERDFSNHARIKGLLIKTYANGLREIKVFGQGGLTKSLPEEKVEMALNASADEIADVVGLHGTRRPLSQQMANPYEKKLQPQPSTNFPVRTQPVYVTPVQENPPTGDSAGQTQESTQKTQPTENNESSFQQNN